MEKKISSLSRTELMLRMLRKFGITRSLAQQQVRRMLRKASSRDRLNNFFRDLTYPEKEVFQNLTSKIFRESEPTIENGVWIQDFLGKELRMPLRNGSLWLDWDNAVSITGHDIEVKRTYESVILSPHKPKVFFDVGANYGTHSLLFLIHEIEAVSFEPNPACVSYFQMLCELNSVNARSVQCAVGDKAGTADFWFPERDTWLGTMVKDTKDFVIQEHNVEQISVDVITLDEFSEMNEIVPDLIKIDTEGNEVNVLRGAQKLLTGKRPLVIFESNHLTSRPDLFDLLDSVGYTVSSLPYDSKFCAEKLFAENFASNKGVNFVAVPEPRGNAGSK